MCDIKRSLQLFSLYGEEDKKVIMIDNQKRLSPGERGTKKKTQTVWHCFFFQVHKQWCQRALPLGVVFLLVQDTAGSDPRPHGFEWQHIVFFSFYDLDMTRWAQCPLWCLSEMAKAAPSHCDFIQQVLFGPFILREVSSLEANCRFAWIVDFVVNHLQTGKTPPPSQVT